jgi:hypothetical protein
MSLQLYVKHTSNCEGLPLQTFDLLGPTWQGDSVTIPFVDPGGNDGDSRTCVCGHDVSEHARSGECQADACLCGGFDADPGDGFDETLVDCEVTGWTDLFGGRPCPVHVAWTRRLEQPTPAAEEIMGWPDWQRSAGILIWGGNAGIRATGPGAYEEGIGMPIMWLEDPALLPEDVRAAIRPTDHPELPA